MDKDINFALIEETRPQIYTSMKYWGKKPHNIWRAYIKTYTPEGGLCLDSFAGSAVSAFEGVKAGRKVIAFDLNPLTAFIIEVYCSNFDKLVFKQEVQKIIQKIQKDPIYAKYFSTKCNTCNELAVMQHAKWEDNKIYEIGVKCKCNKKKQLQKPINQDHQLSDRMKNIKNNYWYPKDQFYQSTSFPKSFKDCVGGNHFYKLWTERNLYVLSRIFNEIIKTKDEDLKKQLLFGFTQSIHLCTKMCVPRRGEANRPFSTSWGRSAYLCSNRQMEMNPLLVFKSNCFGKQSVESCLSHIKSYLGKIPKIVYVDESNKKSNKKFDIKYGIIDVTKITNFIDKESIDFIITDPPYGGLVKYLDLSTIFLIWLKKTDKRYNPDYENEIITKDKNDFDLYKKRFQKAIKNLTDVLKPEGKIVFTFHNKKIQIWNTFLKSLREAGLNIEKVIHQINRRSGESVVAEPYGTSGTDFYIRCVKNSEGNTSTISTGVDAFKKTVISTAISIIAQRNEPTPYVILFDAILSEISMKGFDIEEFDINIKNILTEEINKTFEIKDKQYWWFKNPRKHINYPDKDLSSRVEDTIINILRRQYNVKFDEVLAEIFMKYPNGLTPEKRSISNILSKYATRQSGMWQYQKLIHEQEFTNHTKFLVYLSELGRKMAFKVFIGKKEQSDKYKNKKLSNYADIHDLTKIITTEGDKRKRLEQVDMLWIRNNKVQYAIEVENSTKFLSGLHRASNLGKETKKVMVLPDRREKEFLKLETDEYFFNGFKDYNWSYLLYSDIEQIKSKDINKNKFNRCLKHFKEEVD